MKLRLFILIAICAVVALTFGSAEAAAVGAMPTYPIPADVGPVAPPIPALPAADETPPPADQIADPVTPAAVCGGWYRQSNYGGSWPAASTWWEYTCTYWYPQCGPGACTLDWYPSNWTDYFYWDGSKPVFEGEFERGRHGCDTAHRAPAPKRPERKRSPRLGPRTLGLI